jgi:membrane-associated phospholipid phosphatase
MTLYAPSDSTQLKMRRALLILCSVSAAILLLSNLTGYYDVIWKSIDIGVFRALNDTIGPDKPLTHFWAWTNAKMFDKTTFVVMMTFCGYLVISSGKGHRLEAAAKIFAIGFLILIAVGVSKQLLDDYFHPSPGYLLTSFNNINDYITGYTVKTSTDNSFPGDHAMTSALFAGGVILLFRGRPYAMAFSVLLMVFVCLPRLAGGGHWFTDVVVGGGAACLLLLPWLKISPYVSVIERLLTWGWSKAPAFLKK